MTDTLPPKPQTYNGDLTKLPLALEHLREQQVWLCWSWFWNGKKWTKPPYRADNPERNASSSDPATWGTYEQAIEQVHAGRADGIGVALKGRNLGGVDLDHCRDPETGNIDSQAEERLRQFPDAYAEITVSGTGLHILGISTLENFAPKFKQAGIELFSNSNHYLTLSCNEITSCRALPDIGDQMATIAAELGGKHNGFDFDTPRADHAPHVDDVPHVAPETEPAPQNDTPWSFAEETRLRSALNAIPTNEAALVEKFGHAHDTWVRIGRAIERLDWGERGYAIFRDWSAQNAQEFNEHGLRTQWASFNRNRGAREKPTTIATVYLYAIKFGWRGGDTSGAPSGGGEAISSAEPPLARLALSSAEFVAGFTPPDYLIVGWLQRRFVYSLTATTGDGKTAVALLITLLISQGFKLGKLEVKCGRVLYFAGENPDDVRMRWMATTQQFGLTPEDVDRVYFVPGVFKFTEISERIHQEMETRELGLVVVDTSATYFETDDENNNMQALAHAKRLRELSRLPGGPTVLICCHPTKNAESLVPRGGGAFLNEVDGNLTCKRDDLAVELHWCGKFRGPDFAPLLFQLRIVTHERLKDTEGNLIQTVVALPLTDEGLKDMTARIRNDEDRVLLSISESPRLSSRDRAQQLNWLMKSGDPYHMRVVRAEKALERAKLIKGDRDGWEITDRGKKEAERLKSSTQTGRRVTVTDP
jgi:AAA domain/Primase C terminal 2 (PriCT-2)